MKTARLQVPALPEPQSPAISHPESLKTKQSVVIQQQNLNRFFLKFGHTLVPKEPNAGVRPTAGSWSIRIGAMVQETNIQPGTVTFRASSWGNQ